MSVPADIQAMIDDAGRELNRLRAIETDHSRLTERVAKLEERCEAYKGQVEWGAAVIEALRKERDAMVEALRWYADTNGKDRFYIVDETGQMLAQFAEIGDRARAALPHRGSRKHEPSTTL